MTARVNQLSAIIADAQNVIQSARQEMLQQMFDSMDELHSIVSQIHAQDPMSGLGQQANNLKTKLEEERLSFQKISHNMGIANVESA